MFSVPILDPDGKPLYAVDSRVMPEDWLESFEARSVPENAYGPLWKLEKRSMNGTTILPLMKQVHARGRMDQIVQMYDTEQYVLRDYKTVGKALDDNYFRHLDLDEQCTTYLWAAPLEATMLGLEYTEINNIQYVALRKSYPKPPTELKNGLPSINRQEESTTPELFEKFIKDNNLKIVYDASPKLQDYYTYLVDKGDKQFIDIRPVRRNKAQIKNAGLRLYYEAVEMLNKDLVLYPNPSNDYRCLNCIFRAPCIAAEDGSDWKGILDGNYIRNYDR